MNIKKSNSLKTMIGLSIALMFIFNMVGQTAAGMTDNTQPITIFYDPTDRVTTNGAMSIRQAGMDLSPVQMIPVTSGSQLLQEIKNLDGVAVYVFHGSREGWTVGQEFVRNAPLANAISNSPGQTHLMAACYSDDLAQKITNKEVGNLFGNMDVEIAKVMMIDMLINHYAEYGNGYTNVDVAQEKLDTYIQDNGMKLLRRLLDPIEPLGFFIDGGIKNVYTSSYTGLSGFYPSQISESMGSQVASNALNTFLSLIGQLDDVGLSIEFDWTKTSISGNAWRTWYTSSTQVIRMVQYDVRTWYSASDYVAYYYNTLEAGLELNLNDLKAALKGTPSGDKCKNLGLAKVCSVVKAGTWSVVVGGSATYTFSHTYTNSPASTTYSILVNGYASANHPTGFSSWSLFVDVSRVWEIGYKISKGSLSYEGTLLQATIGGQLKLTRSATTGIKLTFAIYATVAAGVSFPGTVVNFNILLVLAAGQFEWNANGVWQGSMVYGGIWAGITGKVFFIPIPSDAHLSGAYTIWNSLGRNVNAELDDLADDLL